jgi:hypothetical protein
MHEHFESIHGNIGVHSIRGLGQQTHADGITVELQAFIVVDSCQEV